jgi:hypothetical protein
VERRSHFDSCSFTRRFTYVLSLSGQFRYVEIQARELLSFLDGPSRRWSRPSGRKSAFYWQEAGVTLKTVVSFVVNFLVTPFPTGRLVLTEAASRCGSLLRELWGGATGVGIVVPTIEDSRLRSTGQIRGRLSE